jgi:hypothetical protein
MRVVGGLLVADRRSTGEKVQALVQYLEESPAGYFRSYVRDARDLADDLSRADGLRDGDERYLALAEARDRARILGWGLTERRKGASKNANAATRELEYVSDASPWIGNERFNRAQRSSHESDTTYNVYATACSHVGAIVRSLRRDLQRETAAGRARGVSRVIGISRRLIELAIWLRVVPEPASQRRRCWSHVDELGQGAHPRLAQMAYALQVLLQGRDLSRRDFSR